MKVLVTGTAGFIGFHLVNRLIARGDEVVGVDSINDYYDVHLKYDRLRQAGIPRDKVDEGIAVKSEIYPNYSFMKMGLENKDKIDNIFKEGKFDAVCNLAAQAGVRYSLVNPYAYVNSNIIGFINLLEASRHNNIKHLVYASSSSVYGLNKSMPFSTSHNVDHPVSLYAASKKSNELMAHSYSHLYGIPTTGLRFFTVYGPWGRPDMAYFLFTKAILKGEPIKVFNHGKMMRDFTYIDDIVEGVIRVIDKPPIQSEKWDALEPDPSTSSAPFSVFNIGNNKPVKLMDFIEAIEKALDIKAHKVFMPIQPGDVEGTFANVQPLIDNFDYKPDTPLIKGIQDFVAWYKQYYKV